MIFRLLRVVALAAIMLSARSAGAQQRLSRSSRPDSSDIASGLARVDSLLRVEHQHELRSAAIGAVAGGAVGYGLARLAHHAFCEGAEQCAEFPRRAVRASVIGGAGLGALVGAAISWLRSTGER
jgi:hypothetical protein